MDLTESVARTTDILFARLERTAREDGLVPPPTAWAFAPRRADPFIGYASTRPFYKGRDTVHAIERLGLFPAAYAAPLVMVSWEQSDLLSALEVAEPGSRPTLVTVVANLDGRHHVALHPYEERPLSRLPSGRWSLGIDWGSDIDLGETDLFPPIHYLLALWRQQTSRGDGAMAHEAVAQMRAEGFTVELANQTTAPARPA